MWKRAFCFCKTSFVCMYVLKVTAFIETIFGDYVASYIFCPSISLSSCKACSCMSAFDSKAKILWETARIPMIPERKRSAIEV